MANVLLGVTGSVAAIKVPELAGRLREAGHELRIVTTKAGSYFFNPGDVVPESVGESPLPAVITDADEWPGLATGERYRREDPVLHIELRRWADLFLVAPLDANTLAKFAAGLADNCLSCVWRAWDPQKPVVLAPAMNTHMWLHPMTLRQLRSLAIDFGAGHVPGSLGEEELIAQLNARAPRMRIVPPVSKRLACGDVGPGAMAEISVILSNVTEMLASGG